MMQAMALLLGGGMALAGRITAQQLTSFYLYVDFVIAASLSVCDQWGAIMVRNVGRLPGQRFAIFWGRHAVAWPQNPGRMSHSTQAVAV